MLAHDVLLTPIAGPSRAGSDLRYAPLYDQIKEARREDDDAPQGDWQHTRKTADWALVTRLATDALASKSKDLQIAAWLTEAQLRREGFAGLRDALTLLARLLQTYWDDLYPELEDGDTELRAAPLEWIGLKLDTAVRQVPLDRGGHDFLQYKISRAVGYESDTADDEEKQAARARAIEEGRLTAEEFDEGFDSTPKPWYKALVADLDGTLEALRSLDAISRERFGDDAPSYRRLGEALEEVRHTAGVLLRRKLELDPDPVAEVQVGVPTAQDGAAGDATAPAGRASAGAALTAEPTSREDAAARIVSAARFLRREAPTSPAPYLLLRGFRWGELRAHGNAPDPRLFEAPPTQVRSKLKGLMLDERWEELLEQCETVMGSAHGRGWLDLQRYVLTACGGLGTDYDHVAAAIRAELRTLLAEIPELADMMMMDDTPAANAETKAWLRDAVLADGGESGAALERLRDVPAARPENGDRRRDPAHEHALSEVRAGRADKAIQPLMRELDREKTRRGRFLRQVQIADIMMEAALDAIARPILEELVTTIETHKLDEWESGELVARPMALLHRCLAKAGEDPATMQALYLRICRLDPVQAINVAQG